MGVIRDCSILNKVIVNRNHRNCGVVGNLCVVSARRDRIDSQSGGNGDERIGRGCHWQVV